VVQFEIHRPRQNIAFDNNLVETVGMAKKRTKSDKAQRQADQVEKRTEAHPDQTPKKRKREDFSQAAARIVREATENK
jgi:hypothetical protein